MQMPLRVVRLLFAAVGWVMDALLVFSVGYERRNVHVSVWFELEIFQSNEIQVDFLVLWVKEL